MSQMVVRPPGQVPFTVPLRDGMVIGRHDRCDLPLDDPKVSRRHAVLAARGGGWAILDQGSTHGTFVNEERVTARDLAEGDRVRVGETRLTIAGAETASEVLLARPSAQGEAPHPAGAAARLDIFYQVAAALQALDDVDALIGRMLEAILAVLGCERGLVGVCEPSGGLRRIERSRGGPPGDVVLSRSILDAIVVRRQAVLVREPAAHGTLLRERVLSAMAVPLLAGDRVLGLLHVDDRAAANRFSDADLHFLGALGHLTAAAIVGAERYERAAAGETSGADAALSAIVGESDGMARLRKQVRRFAEAGSNVLVHGESGTGKELVARALHACSRRAERPFVALNCAAIPESMVESELFGHRKGAFTGADRDRRGKLALAHRGTLLLDEIGDLALAAQAKLLRALQEGEVQPLGAEEPLKVDVRVIAASHKDLLAEARQGRFREDLYYRLAVVELSVPPLRAREGDVVLLAKGFLVSTARRLGRTLVGFSPEALSALRAYGWPGNVRELQNEVERAAIIAEGALVERGDLSARVRDAATATATTTATATATATTTAYSAAPSVGAGAASLSARFAALDDLERALVVEALAAAKGNVTEAGRLLGISRIMMRRRVEKLGLVAGEE